MQALKNAKIVCTTDAQWWFESNEYCRLTQTLKWTVEGRDEFLSWSQRVDPLSTSVRTQETKPDRSERGGPASPLVSYRPNAKWYQKIPLLRYHWCRPTQQIPTAAHLSPRLCWPTQELVTGCFGGLFSMGLHQTFVVKVECRILRFLSHVLVKLNITQKQCSKVT